MAKRRASREGHVYQLPSGNWRAQIYVQGQKVSYSSKRQSDVLEWIRKTKEQVDQGLTYSSLSILVRQFAADWLAAKQPALREGTYIQYEQIFRDYINPAIGSMPLRELRPDQVQTLYSSLQRQGKGAYLVRKIHGCLHACFDHARILGTLSSNPTDHLIIPPAPDDEMQILDSSEISRLLLAVRENRYEALIRMAIHTGMRQMELLGLRWSDLDWAKKTIRVRRQLKRKKRGQDWSYGPPKTKAGRRTLGLGDPTMATLRRHFERQQLERAAARARWQEHGMIFATRIGTPTYPKNMTDDFKILLRDAGLPTIRFHDLRHTAASVMIEANKSVLYIAHRLGHARPSITLNIYGHLMPESLIGSADELDELISPVELEFDDIQEAAELDRFGEAG